MPSKLFIRCVFLMGLTSSLNQYTLTNNIKLYQYKNDELEEIEVFQNFLEYAMGYYGWIRLNNFYVDSLSNCYILSHKAATDKEITCIKTDTLFQQFAMKNIPLNNYAPLDELLVLKNRNIVLLSINEDGNWSYFIYNEAMVLLHEIKISLYRKYYPMRFKETKDNLLVCLYSLNITSSHDCVIQKVQLP